MFKKLGELADKIDPEMVKKAIDSVQEHIGRDSTSSRPSSSSKPSSVPIQQEPRPQNGRKKALLIGINYFGTKAELRGCINDVNNIHQFITTRYGFNDIQILTDDPQSQKKPTRDNILAGFKWLCHDAQPGDSFFLHFSGHGAYQRDEHGDETDGNDETICPVDYERSGMITDDVMHTMLVDSLPKGSKLTAIFDCCHSGTMLDLPFTYQPDASGNEILVRSNTKEAIMAGFKAFKALKSGDTVGAIQEAMRAVRLLKSDEPEPPQAQPKRKTIEQKMSKADVLMFSGCKDCQTSADASIEGQMSGAMSWGILQVLKERQEIKLNELLLELRGLLKGRYKQIPQMSSGYEINVETTLFSLV
jgi:metacaspase-1